MPSVPKPPAEMKDIRARAIEMLVSGQTVVEVAEELGKHRNTIRAWRNSEEGSAYFDRLMKHRFSEVLPIALNSMMKKVENPKSPLIGVVKAFESIANRSGHPEQRPIQEQPDKGSLQISINLGDDEPSTVTIDHDVQMLKQQVAQLMEANETLRQSNQELLQNLQLAENEADEMREAGNG